MSNDILDDTTTDAEPDQQDGRPYGRYVKKAVVWAVGIAAVIGSLYASYSLAGIVDTIVYTILFLVGLIGIPTTITLMAPSFPRFLKNLFGKLNFILGQLAFGTGYLVQRETGWEMCAGKRGAVYIDGTWYNVDDVENMSVLGWQPFGVIFDKTVNDLEEVRVDEDVITQSEMETLEGDGIAGPISDGGTHGPSRGGFKEVAPSVWDGRLRDGDWLVDLKRVISRGLADMGDIKVVEKAEEVAMRDEASESSLGGMEPVIGSIVGIILGVMVGYIFLGA